MIFDLLLSFLFGLGLHQTRRVTVEMPHGWQNIAEHSIGGVGIAATWAWWYLRLSKMPDGFLRGAVAMAFGLLSLGAGVVAGWVADGWNE